MIKVVRILKIIAWPIMFIGANLYLYILLLVSLLPHVIVKKGDHFETIKNIPTKGLSHWHAPATFSFECTIPSGTVLVAISDSPRISRGFCCIPLDKSAFEQQFVPENIRSSENYNGYSFVFKYSDIGKRIKRISC